MLFVGTQTNDPDKRIEIDFDGLLHHTLIVGQSGSGKSFFVARLIEEILLRTRARIIIVDPNGDFRRISIPSVDIWPRLSDTFIKLNSLTSKAGIDCFDEQSNFKKGWEKRRFMYLTPGRGASGQDEDVVARKLLVHWDTLADDQRKFLLNASSSTEPKIFLGLKAVAENAVWISRNRPGLGSKMDLRGLLEIAQQFAESNIGMKQYDYARTLTRDDWYAVQAKIDDLLSQYSIWWSLDGKEARPPGLSDFIDGPFDPSPKIETYWDTLVLSLDSAPAADTLLSADVALSRMWLRAKSEWRKRAETIHKVDHEPDGRVPTFIVIDEAHNFAPEHPTDPLGERVTTRLMQIASEGRKYGLYLILATQRPTKLHPELVAECENACVLRLQSKIETDFAVKVLGLSDAEAHAVPSFTKGQGVFFGRWVGGTAQLNTKIAPARTIVGGGEIASNWKSLPPALPELGGLDSSIAEFVVNALHESRAPIVLATLSWQVMNKFGQSENWFGHLTFRQLLNALKIDNLQIASTPPGFAYLDNLHKPPAPDKSLAAAADSAELLEIVALLRTNHPGMPQLREEQYRYILEAISNEVQTSEFNFSDTSKSVRDRLATHEIGRNAVSFVLKGLTLGGHKFDSDRPQDVSVLAEAFTSSLLTSLTKKGVTITDEMRQNIRKHFSGGTLK